MRPSPASPRTETSTRLPLLLRAPPTVPITLALGGCRVRNANAYDASTRTSPERHPLATVFVLGRTRKLFTRRTVGCPAFAMASAARDPPPAPAGHAPDVRPEARRPRRGADVACDEHN